MVNEFRRYEVIAWIAFSEFRGHHATGGLVVFKLFHYVAPLLQHPPTDTDTDTWRGQIPRFSHEAALPPPPPGRACWVAIACLFHRLSPALGTPADPTPSLENNEEVFRRLPF